MNTLLSCLLTACLLSACRSLPVSDSGAILVEWTTKSEINTAGFNLYRSETAHGEYDRINDGIIPASGDPLRGGSYQFEDVGVVPAATYYYQLEDLGHDGTATRHGPIHETTPAQRSIRGWILATMAASVGGLLAWGMRTWLLRKA